jgi:hypothetical protein
MSTPYKFAPLPSSASVADLVTMAVCAWFLVAAVTILADPARADAPAAAVAVAAVESPAPLAAAPVIAPEARLTIVVQAPRLKPSASL